MWALVGEYMSVTSNEERGFMDVLMPQSARVTWEDYIAEGAV